MKEKIGRWVKKEAVLVISAGCALLSLFIIPPTVETLSFIDTRVLILLFCLMAVVAGLQRCGLFVALAQRLLRGRKDVYKRQIHGRDFLLPYRSDIHQTVGPLRGHVVDGGAGPGIETGQLV